MNVIIAEDEKLAAERLEHLVMQCDPTIRVTARYDSVEELVEYFRKSTIDLLFLDIQLADGKSFEVFKKVDVNVPIIFTTAFDQFALQAFKVHSIDYLLKPIDQHELKAALKKFHALKFSQPLRLEQWEILRQLAHKPAENYKQRFVTKFSGKLLYKQEHQIAYFFAEDKSTFLVTKEDTRKFLIDHTLEELEKLLDPQHFFRVSRKAIVRVDAIAEVKGSVSNGMEVMLLKKADFPLHVSRDKINDFKKWLDR